MSVYVDRPRWIRGTWWAHLSADTDAELEAMARFIGLKQEWKGRGHYDVQPGKRSRAIKAGAVPCSARVMVEVRRRCVESVGAAR